MTLLSGQIIFGAPVFGITNATITIGGNGINGSDDMNSLTVIEFEVTKNV